MPHVTEPPTQRGACRVLFCFSLGRAIDLDLGESVLAAARRMTFHHRGRFPTEAGVAAPVRVSWNAEPADVLSVPTDANVEIAVYAFGAVAITWSLPVDCDLNRLAAISAALYEHEDLRARSRRIAEQIQQALGAAVDRPLLSSDIEDYWVFDLEHVPGPIRQWHIENRRDLARVLRASSEALSDQEIDDANGKPVSYGENDLALVDWLGAILVGEDTRDERLLLELATVELLELRLLDARLDQETTDAYRVLATPKRSFLGWRSLQRELDVVAKSQADDALLHLGIDNALKLFGDDYLARLYRVAAERFHFDDWDAAIQRKIGVLERIYTSLDSQASHRRSETLEWIIILLIAIDILLYFTPLR